MKNCAKKSALLMLVALMSGAAFADQAINYTYNTNGQILTEDGARTDVNDVTTYTYDAAGNRATMTNALSQVVHYNSYDAAGRLLSVTDANGITTEFTYHDRGWLLTSRLKHPTNSSLDSITSYTYDAVGQMLTMTLPNGYQLGYEYDGARRLTAIKTPAGERIEYTLDLAGNRTKQVIKNNLGTIVYSVNQAFDELSRVMLITGNHNQIDKRQYDPNDNPVSSKDGRNNTTQQTYDALNRVAKVIDPKLAETQFTYDTQDRIKTVTDARGNTTTYNYDGLGNLLSLVSPDTGTTTFTYDAAGNRLSATDARGVVVNYTYDALNRLTSVSYPASPGENISYTYDNSSIGSYGIGRLYRISNSTNTQTYTYDHRGLITQKQVVQGSLTSTTSYSYDIAGNVIAITYPSGRLVNYVRDSAGRIQSITTKENAGAALQTVIANQAFLPFGPASNYSYGNGLTHVNAYDNDYRLTGITVGGVLNRTYSFDATDNILGITNAFIAAKSQTFTYDELNRLTSANGIYGYQAFSYDAVGNRTGQLSDPGTGIVNDTYTYAATSNRLTGITSTKNNVASGSRSFSYDNAGNTTQATSETGVNQTYTFNNANRLNTAKANSSLVGTYTYNALGQRTSKVAGSTQEFYHYDEAGQLLAVTDSTGKVIREYIYNGAQLVGFVNVAASTQQIAPITLTSAAATLQGANLSKAQSGYTGSTGFIDYVGEGQASWPLNVVTSATYYITVRYSLAATNRPLDIWIDGVKTGTFTFAATADWNTWKTVTLSLSLTSGSHTFILKTTGNSGPNVDSVSLVDTNAPAAGAPPPPAPNGTGVANLYYVHNDHLGTPQVVTAQNQGVVWMADFQPFGKLQANQTNSIELYSRFPGQYVDKETGNYYNYFRDYDPSIGRYIESDPIGLNGGINTYGYVSGNPIRNIDPLGLLQLPDGRNCEISNGQVTCPPDPNEPKDCKEKAKAFYQKCLTSAESANKLCKGATALGSGALGLTKTSKTVLNGIKNVIPESTRAGAAKAGGIGATMAAATGVGQGLADTWESVKNAAEETFDNTLCQNFNDEFNKQCLIKYLDMKDDCDDCEKEKK